MTTLGKTIGWLAAAGVLIAAGAAFYMARSDDKAEQYLTAAVEKGDIEETVSALGNIQPLQYVDVGTQVTGQLKSLHVAVGDVVKQGDLVAEIDPTLFVARVDGTKATLQNLQAQLTDRLAQKHLADQQYKRNKELLKANAVSEELLEQSSAAAEQTAAQVQALRAQIQQTLSALAGDEANLRYTKIFAPMSGTIVSLTARQGQTLVSSQQAPTILRIANLNTMTVWAQVSEADVPKVSIGMPVYFNTLGQPERRWNGKVRQIMPTPESVNNVVLYNVLFDVDNPDQALKTQMSAQVYFLVARADGALLVPATALQMKEKKGKADKKAAQGGEPKSDKPLAEDKPKKVQKAEAAQAESSAPKPRRYTVKVLKDGQVEDREITVGVQNRVQAQVLSGLQEGEVVVIGTASGKDKNKSRELPRPGAIR